jgi:hypothetical protein
MSLFPTELTRQKSIHPLYFVISFHEQQDIEVMGAFDPLITYEKGTFIGKLFLNECLGSKKLTDRDGYRQ